MLTNLIPGWHLFRSLTPSPKGQCPLAFGCAAAEDSGRELAFGDKKTPTPLKDILKDYEYLRPVLQANVHDTFYEEGNE